MRNECLDAAIAELSSAGVRDVKRSYGSKHLQLRWVVNGSGIERMYSLPITPSDWRSASNTRATIRRILREDGMLKVTEPKPPRPKPPNQVELLKRQIKMLEERNAALERRLAVLEQKPMNGSGAAP